MTPNQSNIDRRVYLTSIAAGLCLTAGCTSSPDSDTPTSANDVGTEGPSPEEPQATEESPTCDHAEFEDDIDHVSQSIHRARRKTYELLDETDIIRARRVSRGGDELVILPPGIYRGEYKRYILSTEKVLRYVEQNRDYIDQAHDAIDLCDTPVPDALHGVLDDVEQKTDLFVSSAESFISAAEEYVQAGVYLVDNPGGSGIQFVDMNDIPDPAAGRRHLLDAISYYEEGQAAPGVPSDLETQIRFEAR